MTSRFGDSVLHDHFSLSTWLTLYLPVCLSAAYNDSYQVQTNDNCPPDQYFIQEDSGEVSLPVCLSACQCLHLPVLPSTCLSVSLQVRNNPKRSCQFNRTMLEECSGVSDRFYGYSRGEPCILIKLNRVHWPLTSDPNTGLNLQTNRSSLRL